MIYDTIIIGGGAAGLSAGLYSARYGHSTLVIKGDGFEGSTLETWAVENYPGHLKIDGIDLVQILEQQAAGAGAELIEGHIKSITKKENIFEVRFDENCKEAKSIIYATGTIRRKLGLPKEDELKGRGITYCATCDGPLYRGKTVGVVGGGDSAAKAALILAQYTEKVYIIAIEEVLISEPINTKAIEENPKIELKLKSHIQELIDENSKLSAVKLKDGSVIKLDGLFIEIGGYANVDSIKKIDVKLNEAGYIKVDHLFGTNVPGFFAAGDVSDAFGGFKQIITAAAGGSTAANSAHNFLSGK